MKKLAALLLLGLAGCGSGDFFPLDPGLTGSFRLRTLDHKESIALKRRRVLSVAGRRGIEIEGPNGVVRFAWDGHVLVADQLANGFAQPPLPFLDVNLEKGKTREWTGQITVLEKSERATAVLAQTARSDVYRGISTRIIQSTLTVRTPTHEFEIVSDFAQGSGLLLQQHRTDSSFNYEMTRQ